jgi:GDP-mannose transporter
MTLLNKAAIKAFTFPYFLCILQNLATLAGLAIVVSIAPKDHKIFGLKVPFDRKMLKHWMPSVILFCTMLVSSMSAMKTMSVTSILVVRALTPLVTLVVEGRILGASASLRIWASLTTILAGSVCYVLAEIHGDVAGYVWLGVNLIAAALYHVYVKFIIGELKLSTMDMVLYNNAMSIPILFLVGLVLDHAGDLPEGFAKMDGLAWLWVILSLIVAGAISFSGFGLQACVSATSATVVNQVNKVASFIGAALIFHDHLTPLMILGTVISMGGTAWYSAERLMERKAPKPAATAPAIKDEKTPLNTDTKQPPK